MADDKCLVPAGGFYMYSVGTNESLQRNHTMKRLETITIPKPGENAATFLAIPSLGSGPPLESHSLTKLYSDE
jgi:hypothetical protein